MATTATAPTVADVIALLERRETAALAEYNAIRDTLSDTTPALAYAALGSAAVRWAAAMDALNAVRALRDGA